MYDYSSKVIAPIIAMIIFFSICAGCSSTKQHREINDNYKNLLFVDNYAI